MLYPKKTPRHTGRLRVSAVHDIYYEECGNPSGKPAVLVHGGPGGGSNPTMRRYHDPERYRIILFDQRGCGRSSPHASLEENTTWALVEDMERLRAHLDIPKWQLFGGSWGSALSLAYAEKYPERVSELILRGIFTLRRRELEWFYQEGCSWIYPDAFEAFVEVIPEEERGDMIAAYYKRLTHESPDIRLRAAKAWSVWEGTTLSLLENPERIEAFGEDDYALAFARIECHFFVNGGFFGSDDQLIANADRLREIPGVIVHGRYDVVTPLKTAWELKARWPGADLRIVPDAGHAMSEPGIIRELVAATRKFANS
jgi:proline iminopeptidase